MARRGGRRGRRSRSRQNRSRRTSSRRTSSRRTSTRRSTPSSRRNSPSNRRATTSRKRQATRTRTTTRRSTPTSRRSTPTSRRASPSNRRATVSRTRRASTPKRTTPTRTTQQRTNQRGSGVRNRGRTGVNASRGRTPTSRRQATRTTRQASPTRTNTRVARNQGPSSFMNSLMGIQAANAQGPMKPTLTRKEQIKARFPGASPNSAIFGMTNAQLSQPGGPFNQAGPGGPESEANYTSYQPGSFYNQSDTNMNLTNALRSTRNLVTTPARMLGINNQFTNRLIPKSNEAIQDSRDQRGPRAALARRRGGGSSRIEQQVAAQQMQPEIAPTIGTPAAEEYIESAPQGDLTRIQSQAYNTQLTSSLANMFGGQGSVGYTPQADMALSPTLRAGQSRGRRRVRLFGGRGRRGGTGDQFSRAGDRIARLTNINV